MNSWERKAKLPHSKAASQCRLVPAGGSSVINTVCYMLLAWVFVYESTLSVYKGTLKNEVKNKPIENKKY